jgi:hypothetical protein
LKKEDISVIVSRVTLARQWLINKEKETKLLEKKSA